MKVLLVEREGEVLRNQVTCNEREAEATALTNRLDEAQHTILAHQDTIARLTAELQQQPQSTSTDNPAALSVAAQLPTRSVSPNPKPDQVLQM